MLYIAIVKEHIVRMCFLYVSIIERSTDL